MVLACENHGYTANGPLAPHEAAIYEQFKYRPPRPGLSPRPTVPRHVYDSVRNGVVDSADYMELDAAKPSSSNFDPAYPTARLTKDVAVDRTVHWSPQAGEKRRYKIPAPRLASGRPKSALTSRIGLLDDNSNAHRYVPKTPPKFNYNVEESWLEPSSAGQPLLPTPPKTSPERRILTPKSQHSLSVPKPRRQSEIWQPQPRLHSPIAIPPETLYPNLRNEKARKRSWSSTDLEEGDQGNSKPVRKITTWMATLMQRCLQSPFGAVSAFFRRWSWGSQNDEGIELVAVETLPTGGKRRSIARKDMEDNGIPRINEFPNALDMPGSFSERSENHEPKTKLSQSSNMPTPPESRDGSQNSQEEVETRATSGPTNTRQQYSSRERTQLQNPSGILQPAQEPTATDPLSESIESKRERYAAVYGGGPQGKQGLGGTMAKVPPRRATQRPNQILESSSPIWRRGTTSTLQPQYRLPRESVLRESQRQRRTVSGQSDRDVDVDELISKASRVKLEPPEQKHLRETISTRRRRERDAKIKAERELEEAQRAAEEARLKEEREAAEAKRRAEEAARQAAEPLIPPLSTEWAEKVEAAMACTNAQQILATTTAGVELNRYDLGCILPQANEHQMKPPGSKKGPAGWLNDEGVNGFIQAIVSRKEQLTGYVKSAKTTPAFAMYDAAWFVNYKKGNDINGIKTWSRRKGIKGEKLLQCEKVFFPVNTGSHWMLLVVSPKDRVIEFLDSAGCLKTKTYCRIAREWLQMELGELYIAEEWTDSTVQSQQQQNFDDCGVFTCANAYAAAKGKSYSKVHAERDMPEARQMIVAVLLNGGLKDSDWDL